MAEPLVREIHIRATPETVFEFFTDARKLTRWLAAEATLDPRPGGVCHQEHPANSGGSGGTHHMRGEFLEVSRPGRVVFTWGFTNPDVGVPPGSSVVDVTLTTEGDGTRLPATRGATRLRDLTNPGARRGRIRAHERPRSRVGRTGMGWR